MLFEVKNPQLKLKRVCVVVLLLCQQNDEILFKQRETPVAFSILGISLVIPSQEIFVPSKACAVCVSSEVAQLI